MSVTERLDLADLPEDWPAGHYVGRAMLADGPSPIWVEGGVAYDVSRTAPTVSELLSRGVSSFDKSVVVGDVRDLALLAPVDLQCIKACGVTFAVSAIERVIEERARGDAAAASEIRNGIEQRIGRGLATVAPGSIEAAALKRALIDEAMWSQYLEVAIGPDAEVFTKAPVLSSVGWGAAVGVRADSDWNNPEPEIVLVMTPDGTPVGATLGNDVNLRDFEGRSALLLGKAKDNRGSCALGPLIRLFDDDFTLFDVRNAEVSLRVEGEDGYVLHGRSEMARISRDPADLAAQAMSDHDYPDGLVLFLGTLFAPIDDRNEPGRGFTHKVDDRVMVSSPRLGRLVNHVATCAAVPPWREGIAALMHNLAARGLLA